MHTELLSAGALVLALPGLALLMLGTDRAKAILVPLLFLALALPIPLSFTERIHLVLRHVATAGTAAIVPMFGVPVFVEGTTLTTAHGALEVADACSGFSTLVRGRRRGDAHGLPGGVSDPACARAGRRGPDCHRRRTSAGSRCSSCSSRGEEATFSTRSCTRYRGS